MKILLVIAIHSGSYKENEYENDKNKPTNGTSTIHLIFKLETIFSKMLLQKHKHNTEKKVKRLSKLINLIDF